MLFRLEVIEAKRQRLWGEVRLAQPPSLSIWVAVLGSSCVCIILALVFGVYLQKETVNGYILPSGGLVQIAASRGGRIVRVFVSEGEHVTAGQPLIEYSGESQGAATGNVLSAQIDQVENELLQVHQKAAVALETLDSEDDRLKRQLANQGDILKILHKRIDEQSEVLAISQRQMGRYNSLQTEGYVSQVQIDGMRQQVLTQQGALDDLNRDLKNQETSIGDLQTQISEDQSKRLDALADRDRETAELQERKIDLSGGKNYLDVAPISGTVSSLQANVGQSPQANVPLISLMPDGSNLQAELLVPSRASGFIKTGDVVRMQIDAYPFQRFGFVNGRIASVSGSITKPGELLAPITITEAAYRVRVAMPAGYVVAYGIKHPLRPGMSLSADVVLDRKRFWQLFLDPLLAASKRTH